VFISYSYNTVILDQAVKSLDSREQRVKLFWMEQKTQKWLLLAAKARKM
jgi:hypothetical protein